MTSSKLHNPQPLLPSQLLYFITDKSFPNPGPERERTEPREAYFLPGDFAAQGNHIRTLNDQMIERQQKVLPVARINVAMMMLGQNERRTKRPIYPIIDGRDLGDLNCLKGRMYNAATQTLIVCCTA